MKKNGFNLGLSSIGLPRKILVIMKLIIVLMTTCLLQVSAGGFAQKLTYSKKGATLEQIFTEIRKQTGYYVVYSENKIDKNTKLDVNFKNTDLKDVLDVIGKSQDLTYAFDERNISLKPKEPGLIENIIARFQAVDVRGKVADSLGNGLAGATVSVKNGKGSTSTDNNGNFLLRNVEDGAVLVVSYLGYVTKEQGINKDFTYIQLQQSTSKLDEVQVMAYGLTSRRLSTGNIATIKAEEIEKQPVDNPLLALMGRVPGLIITPSSGLPGAPISVQLRGQNSINRTAGTFTPSEPLFIVDGVPFVNSLTTNTFGSIFRGGGQTISALRFINPNDIESIDVLKDGDATSIYGSRGANGVILITTKKGKAGSTKININSNFGYGEVARKLDLMNTQQYLEMRREAYRNDGEDLPDFSSPRNTTNYDLTLWDQNRYTDWQEVLAGGKAEQYDFQGTISGGNSNINYIFSGNYNSQGSVFLGDSKDKMGSARLSMQGISPNGKFQTNISASFTGNDSRRPDYSSLSVGLAPNAPALYNSDGSLNWEAVPSDGVASWTNPIASILNVTETKSNLFTGGLDMSYLILPSLHVKISSAFTKNQGNNFSPFKIASSDPFYRGILKGSASFSNSRFNSWSLEPHINYERSIGKGRLTAIFGGSMQREERYDEGYFATGYTNDNLLRSISAAGSIANKRNSSSQYKYTGVFGRVNYNREDKYLANVSARRDGSSRFGPGEQFGNFWSFGSAWVFSNENFLKANPFLSFGKIRFSYGTSGNDRIGDYKYLELYSPTPNNYSASYQGGGQLVSAGATNPYYHWEETRKMEIAIELGLIKDRIFLGLARFRNRSTDQLGNFDLPATGGNTSIIINRSAKIQNTGTELSLESKNIVAKNFSWNTTGNVSIQRNRLLALPVGFFGTALGSFSTYGPNVDPIGKPFFGVTSVAEYRGIETISGVYQFTDIQGKATIGTEGKIIDRFAKTIMTAPKFNGGLRNTFTYKGISFDIFIDFAKQMGRNYLFDNQFKLPGLFDSESTDYAVANMPIEVLDRWQESRRRSDIQKYTQGFSPVIFNNFDIAKESDIGWVDASYIKLRTIALSYSIPQKILQGWKIETLSFNIQGQNLFTITKYKGTDPQTQNVGLLSQLRVVTAGFSIGL